MTEQEIRALYAKEDWGSLVKYAKENIGAHLKNDPTTTKEKIEVIDGKEYAFVVREEGYFDRDCKKCGVKKIRLVRGWDSWHDIRVCPICWGWYVD